MKKEVQPSLEQGSCDVCHRTMLKGERAEPYLTPSRERKLVCALCAARAQREGWIRESVAPETPTRPARESERGRLLGRVMRWRESKPLPEPEGDQSAASEEAADRSDDAGPARARSDSRQVRAVPTNLELKLERAVAIFNDSEHRRVVAGIARTLGPPHVSVLGSPTTAAEVVLTVAWELAWYQYAVDLSDSSEPIQLRARGEELHELPDDNRRWNAQARDDGLLEVDFSGSDEAAAGGRDYP